MSAWELRRNLVRQAGLEIANDTCTGIVAIVAHKPARAIIEEIKKPESSFDAVARAIVDHKLGYLAPAYKASPDTRSMSLISPDPNQALQILADKVPYADIEVPVQWEEKARQSIYDRMLEDMPAQYNA